jgi:transposase-like protein
MPPIRPELLDELLKDYQKPEDLLGQDGLLQQLTKALVERALDGELTHHLGYDKHDAADDNSGNSRNGTTPKTMRGKRGQVQIDVPSDRSSEFEPQLVKKNQTRFDGLDEKIISLYSRAMTQREIQGHLEEIYGVEVSPSLISTVTDAVLDEVRAWQSRPLDALYPILYLDALQVKVKSQGRVTNKAIYVTSHSKRMQVGITTLWGGVRVRRGAARNPHARGPRTSKTPPNSYDSSGCVVGYRNCKGRDGHNWYWKRLSPCRVRYRGGVHLN